MARVAQSQQLQAEVNAMRAIERAYGRAESLEDAPRKRVLTWARDTYHGDGERQEAGD